MKLLIALFGLWAFSVGVLGKTDTEMEIEMDKCLSNAGGTREDFNKLLQGTDIPKLKCFWECMMKADGSMSADGTMDLDKSLEDIPDDMPDRDKIIESVKSCITEKGIDDCETANKIQKCFVSKVT